MVNGTASGCAVSSGQLTSSSAGTCLVTATKAADANYNVASSAQTTVTLAADEQAPLTVTSTAGTYGTALVLAATGGSGTGALTFSATDGTASGCAVSSGQLTSSTAGTCIVTATKAADANFNQASSPATPVTIAKATSTTIVVDNSSAVVTGNTLVYTATVNAPTTVAAIPAGTVAWATTGVPNCTTTTPLTNGVATCSITNVEAATTYSASASFTDTDNRFTASSSSDTTAVVGHAPLPSTPTITNLPSSGVFNGGFTAT